MEFIEYGNPNGKPVVYFHGVPGHPEEAAIFNDCAKQHNLRIICPNRFSIPLNLNGNEYHRFLATAIDSRELPDPINFIGFSIGAHSAIATSELISGEIGRLHLVSAAAPLEDESYLSTMAGEKIFKAAINFPRLFRAIAFIQSLLGKYFPAVIAKCLFYSATGKDKELASNRELNRPGFIGGSFI